jgi:hypothetical protein
MVFDQRPSRKRAAFPVEWQDAEHTVPMPRASWNQALDTLNAGHDKWMLYQGAFSTDVPLQLHESSREGL